MNGVDNHLDELFNKARAQSPEASFEETIERFTATINAAGGGTDLGYWASKLLSLNGGIFLTGALLITVFSIFSNSESELQDTDETAQKITYQDTTQSAIIKAQMIAPLTDEVETAQIAGINITDLISTPMELEQSITNSNNDYDTRPTYQIPEKTKPIMPKMAVTSLPEIKIPLAFKAFNQQEEETLFTVTEVTTDEEFTGISKLAQEVGITFHSHIHHHFHMHPDGNPRLGEIPLIRDLEVDMTIDGTSITSHIKVRVPKRGKFEVTFGWIVNKEGRAIGLTDNNITKLTSKHAKN
jgi:hypothetical protein